MAEKPFDPAEIRVAVDGAINEVVQRTAFAALRNVVLATPVGDPTLWQNPENAPEGYVGGHARRNWQVDTLGSSGSVKGAAGDGGGENGAAAEAINEGGRRIERTNIVEVGRLFIFNNVPYIGVLNTGTSTQAPANFVEKAVQAATQLGGFSREVIR